jgi:hypothetical protein
VNFVRFILSWLALAAALAAVLAILAMTPIVQTWVGQMVLDRHPGLNGSLGSLSAGFSKVEIEDLRLTVGGAKLTIPSMEVRLPVLSAAWNRRLPIQGLIAKGWTLDLRQSPPGSPAAAAAPALVAAQAIAGILGGLKSPCDLSLDGAELEGDLLVPAPTGSEPIRIHAIAKGGGLAAGREGTLDVDASGTTMDSSDQVTTIKARGRVAMDMDSPRTFGRIALSCSASVQGGSFPDDLLLSADVSTSRGSGEESCSLALTRGGRKLAAFAGSCATATGRFTGQWQVGIRDSDLAPVWPDRTLPSFAAEGAGTVDADPGFDRVHAAGRIRLSGSGLGALAPALAPAGKVSVDAGFDLIRSGSLVRFNRFEAAVAGDRPVAAVRSLQPFDFDPSAGRFTPANSGGDWIDVSIRALPLSWIPELAPGLALTGGDAAGEILLRAEPNGWALSSRAPLTANAVAVSRGGSAIASGLDLSLALTARDGADGWQLQAAPLAASRGGRRLATVAATVSGSGNGDPSISVVGTYRADLALLAGSPGIRSAGRSVSGDFSSSWGPTSAADATVEVAGTEPGQSLSASLHADLAADGTLEIQGPIKIARGSAVSQISAEGLWTDDQGTPKLDARLTSESVTRDDLRWLAAILDGFGVVSLGGGPGTGVRIPFWGERTGRLRIGFDRVSWGEREMNNVAGDIEATPGSLRIEGGKFELSKHGAFRIDGGIAFAADAPQPYVLSATASCDQLETASLLPPADSGQDPLLEGRASVAAKIDGNGRDLSDLLKRVRERIRFQSTVGILRLLKTDVASSIPDAPDSSVRDALGSVGSAVGSFFGVRRDEAKVEEVHVPANTEAVLDFTNEVSEIGYDQATVDVAVGPDGGVRITGLSVTSPEIRLTGSGTVAYAKGVPLSKRPLQLDLQLSARGGAADNLTKAGLLSARTDDLGYPILNQPIRLGGTLEAVDSKPWHDLLLAAATRKPAGAKK